VQYIILEIMEKKILLFIILNATFLFAVFPEQPIVSPYIIKGFSRTFSGYYVHEQYQLSFFKTYDYYYWDHHKDNGYYYGYQKYPSLPFRSDGYFNFGYDKAEWGFYIWGIPGWLGVYRLRVNCNISEKGNETELFHNLAVSLFAGTSNVYLESLIPGQIYFGASFGTKVKKNEKIIAELFYSPAVNFIHYRYNDGIGKISNSNPYPTIKFEVAKSIEISVPIAVRVVFRELMRFSFTCAIAPTTAVKTNMLSAKTIYSNGYTNGYTLDDIRFNNQPRIAYFVGIGLHFGNKRYNDEIREKRKEIAR
jgi:hypothetical protein